MPTDMIFKMLPLSIGFSTGGLLTLVKVILKMLDEDMGF